MKKFTMILSHDNGKTTLKTVAQDEETAIDMVMKAEGCPRNAIKVKSEEEIKETEQFDTTFVKKERKYDKTAVGKLKKLKNIKMYEQFSNDNSVESVVNEAEGDLKKLAGKGKGDELNSKDAKIIGGKIAKMSGDELKSYMGMVTALGGYYSGKGAGKEKLTKLREEILAAYHEAKGE